MAVKDNPILVIGGGLGGATTARALRQFDTARYLRAACVQSEFRYLWNNFYHLDGFALPDRLGEAA